MSVSDPALSQRRAELFRQLLVEDGITVPVTAPLLPRIGQDPAPLSFAQQRL